MAITAVGLRITQQNAPVSNVSTMSITPGAIGNIFLLATQVASSSVTTSSVTGGSCVGLDGGTNWTLLATVSGVNVNSMKLWIGKATSTSAANISVTWSGAAGNPCTTAQQFASGRGMGAGTPWATVTAGTLHNASSTTVVFPTQQASATGQLYFGYGSTSTSGSTTTTAGTTTGGWVWQTDGFASVIVHNLSIGPASVTAPNASNSPADTTDLFAVVVTDDPPAGNVLERWPTVRHNAPRSRAALY